ncbi:MAG: membrane protein of unknown function [Promethearchaeota archaeon]|nr:MAG: membrane protein of unknown function [Candidatus Lokiarchaeota archaeon]
MWIKKISDELEETLILKPIGFYNRLFKKIPAPYFGLIGYGSLGIFIAVALILYIVEDPTFSIFEKWISNLSIGPNGSNIFFFLGMTIASPFMLLFHYSLVNSFYYKTNKINILLFLYITTSIQSLGSFMAGIFPLNLNKLHGFVGEMYFFGSWLFYSGLVYLYIIVKGEGGEKLILCGICSLTVFIFNMAKIYTALTGELFPVFPNYFLEWIVYLTFLFSNFRFSLIMLEERRKAKKKSAKTEPSSHQQLQEV